MKTFVLSSAALMLAAGSAFAQPANDHCENAQPISGFGETPYDTTGADTDTGLLISCGTGTVRNDVWFIWTATATGSVAIDLCLGSAHDTLMAVYDATSGCPTGAELVCNDDSCGLSSKVTLDVTAGQAYYVRIGGYGLTDAGSGTVRITEYIAPPPNALSGPIVNPANGHTYYLLQNSSWHQAEEWAIELGGHLATVRNIDEHSFIFNNVIRFDGPNFRRGWIGLTDEGREEGDYIWTSGEPVTFTYWGGGEPNHSGGNEFFAQIPWFGAGAWNDNSNLPGDDPTYGVVEIITNPPACPADLGTAGGLPGQDGILDNNDFIAFITYFFNADSHADLGIAGGLPGSDGLYDNNDFIAFISLFFDGCGA